MLMIKTNKQWKHNPAPWLSSNQLSAPLIRLPGEKCETMETHRNDPTFFSACWFKQSPRWFIQNSGIQSQKGIYGLQH